MNRPKTSDSIQLNICQFIIISTQINRTQTFLVIRTTKYQMNKYQIINMIDEGAYGIVWKAKNKQTGLFVAIKQFKQGDDIQSDMKNISKQIKMLKLLKSEYIVNIKQAIKKKNKVFLIFEYFPKNLLNIIQLNTHGLDTVLIKKIIFKITKCIKFLHYKNIIHRDIKPQNILLHKDADVLKLCDFGFARFIPEISQQLTEYVATRWYRSPEILVGDRYGKPADMWALGCILGELVDGQPMFPGENQMDQLYLIRQTCGELSENQLRVMHSNPKYNALEFPPLKRVESIEARYIGKIEKNALNFLKSCLIIDPASRITVQQALTHPFLNLLNTQQNLQANDEQTNLLSIGHHATKRSEGFKNAQSSLTKNPKQQKKILNPKQSIPNQHLHIIQAFPQQPDQIPPKITLLQSKNIIRLGKVGSLPQNITSNILHQVNNVKKNTIYEIAKKFSQTSLKHRHQKHHGKFNNGTDSSPKIKIKKQHIIKAGKVMSEQKQINYNINLSINLKIFEKFKNTALFHPPPLIEAKLPQIKSNSKILKYRQLKHQITNVDTIYNCYGNLSVLGESKEISKGLKKIY